MLSWPFSWIGRHTSKSGTVGEVLRRFRSRLRLETIDYDNTLHVKRDDEEEYRDKPIRWHCKATPLKPKRWGDGSWAKARKIARWRQPNLPATRTDL